MKIRRKLSKQDKINKKIQECKKCSISKLVYNIKDVERGYGKLYGWKGGNKKTRFFFIGMNPSFNRFKNTEYAFGGRDFEQGTGVKFIKILKDLNIIDECFVDNICHCSTKNNKINDEEIASCLPYLLEELENENPDKVIAMGKQVYNTLLQHFTRDNKYLYKLYTIWHPNYVISYQPALMPEYIEKIKEICK